MVESGGMWELYSRVALNNSREGVQNRHLHWQYIARARVIVLANKYSSYISVQLARTKI